MKEGVILIGEDTDWSDYGSLGEMLLQAAQRDITVICLAPAVSDATFPLAAIEKQARSWSFRRAAEAVNYGAHDKMLLAFNLESEHSLNANWVPGKSCQLRGLRLESQGEQLIARTVENEQAWPWLEVQFEKPHQKLIWCGLSIVRDWDSSPVPRKLLYRMLIQHLSDRTSPYHAKRFPGYLEN